MRSGELDLLRRAARELAGLDLTDEQLDRFQTYLDELCLWNRRMNLTGPLSRERIAVELLADSLVPVTRLLPDISLLDVGTGAGLPGLPIKIVRPDIRIDLLEPIGKRTAFLRQAVRLLALEGARVLRGRIEDRGVPLRREGYDVVTARAVAALPRMVRMCAAHVAAGGMLVGFGGKDAEFDLDSARAPLAEAGLFLEHAVVYRPPGTEGERRALFFRKGSTCEEAKGR